jgi:hypothetical protein
LDEAARFAKGKIEALTAIERSIDTRTGAIRSLKVGPLAVPNPGRRRKRLMGSLTRTIAIKTGASVHMMKLQLILKRLHVLLLISTLTALCSAGSLWAQQAEDTTKLAGNWAYSLGPKTLFGLHLERDPARPDHLRGYVVTPEDFSFNVLNGTLLQFSKLSPKSEQQSVASLDWKNGALHPHIVRVTSTWNARLLLSQSR